MIIPVISAYSIIIIFAFYRHLVLDFLSPHLFDYWWKHIAEVFLFSHSKLVFVSPALSIYITVNEMLLKQTFERLNITTLERSVHRPVDAPTRLTLAVPLTMAQLGVNPLVLTSPVALTRSCSDWFWWITSRLRSQTERFYLFNWLTCRSFSLAKNFSLSSPIQRFQPT